LYLRFRFCSNLIPWSVPGNANTTIFCNTLERYCQCMHNYYDAILDSDCKKACQQASCNMDCFDFYERTSTIGDASRLSPVSLITMMSIGIIFYLNLF